MRCSAPGRCVFSSGNRINHTYKVLSKLGEGTFGSVYKVQTNEGQIRALKLLKLWEVNPGDRDILIKRFEMEFETGRIRSKHLVRSYTHDQVEGNPFIIMEFCPKGDLRSKMPLSHLRLDAVGSDILYGLYDLHQCGKVHRDLKPENVLFRADDTAVLTDFGISGDQNKRMTERGWLGQPKQIFGTYGYMPPEQVRPPRGGRATVLPTTDIFSFGVMMYELLVGRLPFGDLRTEADLIPYLNHGREGVWDRAALKRIRSDVNWEKIIEGCLVPNFHDRLQDTEEVLALFPSGNVRSFNKKVVARGRMLLRIMQGEEYGKVYRLDELVSPKRSIITIGRYDDSVSNDIPIIEEDSCYISRRHCTIERNINTQCWYVRDGQWDQNNTHGWRLSLNGTYLNSSDVSAAGILLHDGDIISIGDVKLKVELY